MSRWMSYAMVGIVACFLMGWLSAPSWGEKGFLIGTVGEGNLADIWPPRITPTPPENSIKISQMFAIAERVIKEKNPNATIVFKKEGQFKNDKWRINATYQICYEEYDKPLLGHCTVVLDNQGKVLEFIPGE